MCTDFSPPSHAAQPTLAEPSDRDLLTTCRDLEGQLALQTMEFARALRMRDEYLANLSHELRTPLTSILSMAEAVKLALFGPLSADQQKAICVIEDSGRHLLALINDILDLAKIEAGKMEVRPEAVDVVECCQMAVGLIRQVAREKRVQVALHLAADVQSAYADPLRLKQLLVNLLSNAVKFTPADGQVGLDVSGDRATGLLTFTVWDTGLGIPAAKLPTLFQPFMQLDNESVKHHTGTGLGLTLVRRIAELHHGSVAVASAPGQGTRFTVTLPWIDDDVAARPFSSAAVRAAALDGTSASELASSPLATTDGTSATVLLVDDNAPFLASLAQHVASFGYHVVTASNGVEGVACARARQPDVIVMDLQMSGLDGLQATANLRHHPPTATTPIIALTGLLLPDDEHRCLHAGMNAYLTKPVDLPALRDTLARLLAIRAADARGGDRLAEGDGIVGFVDEPGDAGLEQRIDAGIAGKA
jgi:CheY-like chemotaxis protein